MESQLGERQTEDLKVRTYKLFYMLLDQCLASPPLYVNIKTTHHPPQPPPPLPPRPNPLPVPHHLRPHPRKLSLRPRRRLRRAAVPWHAQLLHRPLLHHPIRQLQSPVYRLRQEKPRRLRPRHVNLLHPPTHHDFLLTPIQSAIIPPTSDTVFALLNCSVDSPVLNHYKSLCFNFSGHSCDELYNSCNAFRLFRLGMGLSNGTNSTGSTDFVPPCCFTGYDTVKFMSMNILDCTHYTSVTNTDRLRGLGPLDWTYGIKLSFAVPDTGCERCAQSGGTCGFDTETQVSLCLCSTFTNSTRECGSDTAEGSHCAASILFQAFFEHFCFLFFIRMMLIMTLLKFVVDNVKH
ncbi:hypothetical protein Prudu_000914 [Prunus dulcis]|uniref:Wall-associated receptor kinase C-terminal domain-containing protein n=1 Tax=Prunus dulcis TaxID=3755 RepID=A0A4Y1QMD0_PRUDU|nr:hypothetical protein Prudu_000914 [Prunus dulcis]